MLIQKIMLPVMRSEKSRTLKPWAGLLLSTLLLSLLAGIFTGGCGYHVENGTPALLPGKILAIESFQNQTAYYKIDQIFTRAMNNEMVRATSYRVVSDPTGADAVLQSTIRSLSSSPVTYSKSSFASAFRVTVNAKVKLIEISSGAVLYENQDVSFSEQYVINSNVENFFSEMNPALSRMADDFASTIVAAILEAY